MLLRSSVRVAMRASAPLRSNAIMMPQETVKQKCLRWLDLFGNLTRIHSRRAWVMDLDPCQRGDAMMVVEYERRLGMVLSIGSFTMFPFSIYLWWGAMSHLNAKPPCPRYVQGTFLGNFKQDYSVWLTPTVASQCKDCRFMEMECKKMCYDRLRDMGMDVWCTRRPRSQTFGNTEGWWVSTP